MSVAHLQQLYLHVICRSEQVTPGADRLGNLDVSGPETLDGTAQLDRAFLLVGLEAARPEVDQEGGAKASGLGGDLAGNQRQVSE